MGNFVLYYINIVNHSLQVTSAIIEIFSIELSSINVFVSDFTEGKRGFLYKLKHGIETSSGADLGEHITRARFRLESHCIQGWAKTCPTKNQSLSRQKI